MQERIKVVIIEDENPARILIKNYLKAHSEFDIIAECENGFEGAKFIKDLKPDLVFLDIQMPKLDGFEMLEILDEIPPIIFSTAYDEFAIKAFDFGAVDYLLKPYSQKRFDKAIEKAKKNIKNNSNSKKYDKLLDFVNREKEIIKRIAIKNKSKIEIIMTKDIERIEAQDDYVFIYTISGERYLKNTTMKSLENSLDQNEFIRVHRSNFVRIDRISKIEQWSKDSHILILKGGDTVKISKTGLKKLKDVLKT
jgi:two-component system LytT family response regulator